MHSITVRKVPDEVHRGLKARAKLHGRSTEAEIRAILDEAVRPEGRVKLGTLLYNIGREAKITDAEVDMINQVRDRTPARIIKFD
ncbi:MAG: Arc family DNA-binding protein [Acidobacteria bacterium]|nr:MAG: Arc family DNA-binding protein [Acidobacteriota bacterium]